MARPAHVKQSVNIHSLATITAIVLAFALPTTALGADTVAPPGNSGVDEYFESVPSASGNKAVDKAPSRNASLAATAAANRRMRRLGADGQAAAALANVTAPAQAPTPAEQKGKRVSAGAPTAGAVTQARSAAAATSDSVVEAAVRTTSHGSGGNALLLALVISFISGLLLVMRRRRQA